MANREAQRAKTSKTSLPPPLRPDWHGSCRLTCVCARVCVRTVQAAVQSVNASLRLNDPRHTVSCLLTSDLQLPQVFPFAAALYHRELQQLQRRSPQVRTHTPTHAHRQPGDIMQ